MSVRKEFTPEFKGHAVRFVLEEFELGESRKRACFRLAPKLSMRAVTLCNWVRQSAPPKVGVLAPPGSVEELRVLNAALRNQNRELVRANAILSDVAAFFGVG